MNRLLIYAAVLAVPLLLGTLSTLPSFQEVAPVSAQEPSPKPPVATPSGTVVEPVKPVEINNVPVVTFTGEKEAKVGKTFVVYYDVPAKNAYGDDNKITWTSVYPKDATPPFKVRGADDNRPMMMFTDAVKGIYKIEVEVQSPDPKLDPIVKALFEVNVGGTIPKPDVPDKPVVVVPDAPAVPTPSAALQQLVSPLKIVVDKGTDEHRAVAASIFGDYYKAMQKKPPTTTGSFQDSFIAFVDQAVESSGMVNPFPGWSDTLDPIMKAHFGKEDATLDKQKAVDFVGALVWVFSQ